MQNNPVYESGNLDDETISDKILDENYFKWGDKVFLKTPLAGVNEQSALIKPLAAARLPNEPHRRRRFQNQMDYGAIILKYIRGTLNVLERHRGNQPHALPPPPPSLTHPPCPPFYPSQSIIWLIWIMLHFVSVTFVTYVCKLGFASSSDTHTRTHTRQVNLQLVPEQLGWLQPQWASPSRQGGGQLAVVFFRPTYRSGKKILHNITFLLNPLGCINKCSVPKYHRRGKPENLSCKIHYNPVFLYLFIYLFLASRRQATLCRSGSFSSRLYEKT